MEALALISCRRRRPASIFLCGVHFQPLAFCMNVVVFVALEEEEEAFVVSDVVV